MFFVCSLNTFHLLLFMVRQFYFINVFFLTPLKRTKQSFLLIVLQDFWLKTHHKHYLLIDICSISYALVFKIKNIVDIRKRYITYYSKSYDSSLMFSLKPVLPLSFILRLWSICLSPVIYRQHPLIIIIFCVIK